MPKVSVIVPNYNHAIFLEKRIESILCQTYQNFDLIILDDCSLDDSASIISKYHSHPKVTKVIYNKVNSGSTFKQWQNGIKQAKGKYIWIAESDDFADMCFLETLVNLLELHPEVGLVYSQSYRVNENGNIICSCKDLYPSITCRKVYKGKEVLLNYMAGANLIPNASAVVFRKEIAKQIDDTYTRFKFSGDWWFWCEMLMRSNIIHICEELNYFRYHTNKVTVSAIKNGLHFVEGLQILELLKQKANLPSEIYINKVKNYANTIVDFHAANNKEVVLPTMVMVRVLWEGFKINKTFIKRVIYLFLRKKLSKVRMIR